MKENQIIYYIKSNKYDKINRTRPQTQKVANTLIKIWNEDYVLNYLSQFIIKDFNKLALLLCRYWKYKILAYNLSKFSNLKENTARKLIENWYKENIGAYLDSFSNLSKKILNRIFN